MKSIAFVLSGLLLAFAPLKSQQINPLMLIAKSLSCSSRTSYNFLPAPAAPDCKKQSSSIHRFFRFCRIGAWTGFKKPFRILIAAIRSKQRLKASLSSRSISRECSSFAFPQDQDRTTIINELSGLPVVIYAEPNANASLRLIPNDAQFYLQWNMDNTALYGGTPDADIDAPEAWDIWQGTSSVMIAIVDGGVDANHPELSGRVSGATSTHNHATHVAGIAAAKGNNSSGVAGVDWNCSINSQIIGDIPQLRPAFISIKSSPAISANRRSWL